MAPGRAVPRSTEGRLPQSAPSHPVWILRASERLSGALREAAHRFCGTWAGCPSAMRPEGARTPRLTSRSCKHGTASSTHCRKSEQSARSVSAPPAIHNGGRFETLQVRSFADLRLGGCVLLRTLRIESTVALRSLADWSPERYLTTPGCCEVMDITLMHPGSES
jgi:hypothetical protein